MEINLWLILVQTLPFAAALFLLNKIIFKPMNAYLAERERNIDGFEREARLLITDVEVREAELESQLDEARAEASAARADILAQAGEEEARILHAAHEEADRLIEEAAERIASEKGAAMSELDKEADSLAERIAGSILGRASAVLLGAMVILSLSAGTAWAGGGDDHGHSAGPDWMFIGMHLVNVIILGFIAFRFGGRPISDFLANRKAEISAGLTRAAEMRTEAEQRSEAVEQRTAGLSDEKASIVAEAKDVAETIKQGRIERAEKSAEIIVEGAAHVIADEEQRARNEVRAGVVEKAVAMASERIGGRLEDADEKRIWDETLTQLREAAQ